MAARADAARDRVRGQVERGEVFPAQPAGAAEGVRAGENTPGRTRELNFFLVNKTFVLVDLPGYGYAKVSKSKRAEWRPLIEGYLRASPALRGIVQLLDVRHGPTDDDKQLFDMLAEIGVPAIIAVTKIDKLTKPKVRERLHELAVELELDEDQMIPFSAVTGEGRDELAEALVSLLEQPDWRTA